MSQESEFLAMLIASMHDAATSGQCTQLQTTITPTGHRPTLVRLIVVPEEMEFVRGSGVGPFRRPG